MAEPFENPGKIDISLGLSGQEEIRQLIAAVGTLKESVQAAHSFSAGMQNAAEQRMSASFRREGSAVPFESAVPMDVQQRLTDAAGLGASTPSGPAPEDTRVMGPSEGASQSGPTIDDEVSRETARRRLGGFRRAVTAPIRVPVDRALEALIPNEYAPRQIDALADPGDRDEMRDIGQAPISGGASGGASLPPATAKDAAWWRTIQEPGVAAPITMPRFGEFTAQDALRMAARPFQLFASSRYGQEREQLLAEQGPGADFGQIEAGGFTGRVAAALGRGAAISPYVSHFGQTYLGMGQAGTPGLFGAHLSPSYLARQGERMGYQIGGTTSDIPVLGGLLDDAGVNFNLPAVARLVGTEGGRDLIQREFRRMRENIRYAGITNEERDVIQERLIGAGRLGGGQTEGDIGIGRAAMRVLSSEGRMGAANPEQIMDALLQATQHGTTNLEEFTSQLEDVPDAADAARIGIDEMTQQMTEMGNFFQNEMGGFFAQGTRFAQDWSRLTGTAPVVGQAAMQNPMVQGMLSLRTGMLPQTFGSLPSGTLTAGTVDTMELLMKAYRGANQGGIVDIPGAGRVRTDGRQADMALAASQMGMSLDVFQGIWNRRNETRSLGNLDIAMDTWRDSMRRMGGSGRGRRMLMESRNPNDQIISAREIGGIMREAGIGRERRQDIQRLMRSDPRAASKEVNKVISQRSEKMRERLEKQSKTKVDVKIDFTGRAKGWLKEVDRRTSERDRNSNEARAGRDRPNRRHRDPDAPANQLHPLSEAFEDYFGSGMGILPDHELNPGLSQYSGSSGWGELGRDLKDNLDDATPDVWPFD